MEPHLEVQVIPHKEQRYDTLGDWEGDLTAPNGRLVIKISDFQDTEGYEGYEGLIAEMALTLHEMVEAFLCNLRGISDRAVDQFDMAWTGDGEPGDAKAAPYHKEHLFASKLERLFIHEAGLTWQKYNELVEGPSYDRSSSRPHLSASDLGAPVLPDTPAAPATTIPSDPPGGGDPDLHPDNLAVRVADGLSTRDATVERGPLRPAVSLSRPADPLGSAVSLSPDTKET